MYLANSVPIYIIPIISGIIATIPLGPVGLFTINKTLTQGIKSGGKSVLGFMIGETIYMIIALLFFNMFASNLDTWKMAAGLITAPILLFLGIMIYKSANKKMDFDNPDKGAPILGSFLLTIVNPTILIFYVGLMAAIAALRPEFTIFQKVAFLMLFHLSGVATLIVITAFSLKIKEKILDKLAPLQKVAGVLLSIWGIYLLIESTNIRRMIL